MDEQLLTKKAVDMLGHAGNTFLHIDLSGVGRLRTDGFVALNFTPEQFGPLVEELREHNWFTRDRRTYRDGEYAMCARYRSTESEAGRDEGTS